MDMEGTGLVAHALQSPPTELADDTLSRNFAESECTSALGRSFLMIFMVARHFPTAMNPSGLISNLNELAAPPILSGIVMYSFVSIKSLTNTFRQLEH